MLERIRSRQKSSLRKCAVNDLTQPLLVPVNAPLSQNATKQLRMVEIKEELRSAVQQPILSRRKNQTPDLWSNGSKYVELRKSQDFAASNGRTNQTLYQMIPPASLSNYSSARDE